MTVEPIEPPETYWGQDCHFGPDRLVSEDEAGRFSTPSGELFVVAGGLAGQAGGGVPARLAVAAFQQYCLAGEGSPETVLKGALLAAGDAVAAAGEKYRELRGLGASLAALLWRRDEGAAWYIHWGDCRLYRFSVDGLHLLAGGSGDRRTGLAEKAETADEGGRLPAALGLGEGLDPEALSVGRRICREEDTFLLCAGGLSRALSDGTLGKILGEPASPRDRARKLIAAAVAAGSGENLTALAVAFRPGPPQPPPSRWAGIFDAGNRRHLKRFGLGVFWGLALGLALIGAWLLFSAG